MTNSDENLLTVAKLREQAIGDLDGDPRLLPHVGFVKDEKTRRNLTFLESIFDEFDGRSTSFAESELGELLSTTFLNEPATEAVTHGEYGLASFLVGVTETQYDGSSLEVALTLLEELENDGAPAFVSGARNPETGKTNTMFKLVSLLDRVVDDLLVLSNAKTWDRTDVRVASMHDLVVEALKRRTEPKVVVIDEGSTHFDARTFRHQVASQWTPVAKRFAKIGILMAGVICHTGMDLHPEAKRLTTLAYWKEEKKEVSWFTRWKDDSDRPTNPLFPGPVEEFEAYFGHYDPDDSSPWAWNLEHELFTLDLDWSELLEELHDRGPTE